MYKKIISVCIVFVLSFTFCISVSAAGLKFSNTVRYDSVSGEFNFPLTKTEFIDIWNFIAPHFGLSSASGSKVVIYKNGNNYRTLFIKQPSSNFKIYRYSYDLYYTGSCDRAILYAYAYSNQEEVSYSDKYNFSHFSSSSVSYLDSFYSPDSLIYSDIPIYDYTTGDLIYGDPSSYSASVTADNDYANFNMSVDKGDYSYYFRLETPSGPVFNYTTIGSATDGDDFTAQFDLVSARSYLEDQDVDFDNCSAVCTVKNNSTGQEDVYSTSLDGLGMPEGLFAHEKEFIKFPGIDEYVEDMPAFPDLTDLDWQDKILAVIRWIGDCIATVVHNLVGILRWLWDSMGVLVKNLGILMYNLVVKLKRLLTELFVPTESQVKDFQEELLKSFPFIKDITDKLENSSFSRPAFSIEFMNKSYSFDFREYLPASVLNSLRTVSTIVIGVSMVFHTIALVIEFLGISVKKNSADIDAYLNR